MESVDVLIVGAGMAGLMAAGRLVEAGKSVIVLDKGRGVGGRMASRRLSADGAARADHGAQYFTCYSETFRPYVEQWLAAGLITQWSTGFYDSEKKLHDNGVPRYVGAQGMTTVPKHLAAQLDVRTGGACGIGGVGAWQLCGGHGWGRAVCSDERHPHTTRRTDVGAFGRWADFGRNSHPARIDTV